MHTFFRFRIVRRRFSHHDDRGNKNETAGMTKNKNMARLRSSPPVLRPPMLLYAFTRTQSKNDILSRVYVCVCVCVFVSCVGRGIIRVYLSVFACYIGQICIIFTNFKTKKFKTYPKYPQIKYYFWTE